MMSDENRPRLGRGLASLLGDVAAPMPQQGLKRVPIEFIKPNPRNPRRAFTEAELADLAESIKQHGVLQPIVVRNLEQDGNPFELVAGERRWRAAQRAGLHDIPVIVVRATDKESLEIAIIENVQRSDLNPIEEALGYEQLINEFGYTQSDLASSIGKSRSYLANALRILKLPEDTRKLVAEGALSAGHARALLSTENPEATARLAVEKGLSVRDLEKIAQSGKKQQEKIGRLNAREADPNTNALEKELIDTLGLPVSLRVQGEKGSVSISFNTLDQLDLILSKLR
jgi:ParB family transcriptional regulator, chromosome partitioning protein